MPFQIKITEVPSAPVAAGEELPMPVEILSLRLETLDLPHVIQTLTKKPRAKRSDAGKRKTTAEP